MSICFQAPDGYRVAELREIKVNGLPGIGCYTLVLNLHFTVTPPKAETRVRNVLARLEWGDNTQSLVAVAIPESTQPVCVTQFSTDVQICFRLPLFPTQIEEIESRRNGGDFKLSLWFTAELEQSEKLMPIADRHEFPVRQQDWIEALERMGYRRTLLFEIPVPSIDHPIGDQVQKAQFLLCSNARVGPMCLAEIQRIGLDNRCVFAFKSRIGGVKSYR